MPKYIVTVEYTTRREKEITVYAGNEAEAEEKACDIVDKWDGITETDAVDIREED